MDSISTPPQLPTRIPEAPFIAQQWKFINSTFKVFSNESGFIEFEDTSPTMGTYTSESLVVASDPGGTQQVQISGTGSYILRLLPQRIEVNPNAANAWSPFVSDEGDVMVSSDQFQDGTFSLLVGMRSCNNCEAYGVTTPGEGGIEPIIGMRSFPTVGNASYGLVVDDGLGGAAAAMALGLHPSAGTPLLGGTLNLDPAGVFATLPVALAGTPGQAGDGSALVPLPIPPIPELIGLSFFAQCFIADGASPGGASMTQGFEIALCR